MKENSIPDVYSRLADILLELEAALRERCLWESVVPSADKLASQLPFCVDTLRFSQWLQFVFIQRIQVVIESQAPLPERSAIVPVAEESLRGVDFDPGRIIRALAAFDKLIEHQ